MIGLKEFSKGTMNCSLTVDRILMKSQKSTTSAHADQLAFSLGTQVNAIDVDAALLVSRLWHYAASTEGYRSLAA